MPEILKLPEYIPVRGNETAIGYSCEELSQIQQFPQLSELLSKFPQAGITVEDLSRVVFLVNNDSFVVVELRIETTTGVFLHIGKDTTTNQTYFRYRSDTTYQKDESLRIYQFISGFLDDVNKSQDWCEVVAELRK